MSKDTYLQIDADELAKQIDALFLTYGELADDEELREGVLLGETDLDKVIERALSQKLEADMMITGLKERIAGLTERAERFGRRSDSMRELIRSLMVAANLKSIPLTEATISLGKGRTSVNVLDVDALDQGFYTTKRQADKTAIKAALEAGEQVAGAELVTSPPVMTIRGT